MKRRTGRRDGGEVANLEITGLSHEGAGVGRHRDKAVFVPGGIPGDTVRARITEQRKRFSRAELVAVERASALRVDPRCSVSEYCGGCSLQAMSYEGQLSWKKRLVEDALSRIGHLKGAVVRDTMPSPEPWHYRNKVMFPVGRASGRVDGRAGFRPGSWLVAGCFRKGTHEIVPAESCLIQHPTNNLILREALKLCEEHRVEPYDERTGRGVLRYIMARVAVGTGESMAAFVTALRRFPAAAEIAEGLMKAVPGLVSVVQNVNPGRTNIVLGTEWKVIRGRECIDDLFGNDETGRLRFRISPLSFYQVNPVQAARVYAKALEYLESGIRDSTALDLYCGIGTITLFLARRFSLAVGIEESPDAVRDARRNARLNEIGNVRFVEGRAEWVAQSVVFGLASEGASPAAVVLDPPRAGCSEGVLDAIARTKPATVAYVSCYPSTLARDLAYLEGLGYRTVEVQPFDMFPQTPHVEAVACIVRA